MSTYGKHWKIDGLISGPILEGRENGSYRILFEREHASLDQIEAVHWDHPSIQRLPGCRAGNGLPEGYAFTLVDIEYQHSTQVFFAKVKTAKQYLGDVTGYQAQIDELTAQISGLSDTAQEAETLKNDLTSAYVEGVEQHG